MQVGNINNVKTAAIFAGLVLGTIYVYRIIQPKVPNLPVV